MPSVGITLASFDAFPTVPRRSLARPAGLPPGHAPGGRAPARRGTRRRAREDRPPLRRPRPARLALHAAQPQRRGAEGTGCARARGGARAAEDRAVRDGLPQGGQHPRAGIDLARDGDVRPDARPGALPPDGLRHAGPESRLGMALRGPSPVAQLHARGRPRGGGRAELFRRQPGDGAEERKVRRETGHARARGGGRRGARAPARLLDEAQRREAVFDSRTYGDIVTGNADKVDPTSDSLRPVGIAGAKLDEQAARAAAQADRGLRRQLRAGPRAGAPRARARGRRRADPLRLGRARPSAASRTTTASRGRSS